MDIALWVLRPRAGVTKLKDPRLVYAAARPPTTSYAEDLSDRTFKIGLILPSLTALAALGVAVLRVTALVIAAGRLFG